MSGPGLPATASLALTRWRYATYHHDVTGEEVRRLRSRLGLSQAQFGELVGVARNSVARWERGEMAIRESAARLMRLLARQHAATRKR